jgi:hypothetical protein
MPQFNYLCKQIKRVIHHKKVLIQKKPPFLTTFNLTGGSDEARLAALELASGTCLLNSPLLPFRLIKQPSPVVQKQHFEVVFVPPARDIRSLVRGILFSKTQKRPL